MLKNSMDLNIFLQLNYNGPLYVSQLHWDFLQFTCLYVQNSCMKITFQSSETAEYLYPTILILYIREEFFLMSTLPCVIPKCDSELYAA